MLNAVADQEVFVPVQVTSMKIGHHDQSEAASPLNGADFRVLSVSAIPEKRVPRYFRAVLDLANDRNVGSTDSIAASAPVGACDIPHEKISCRPGPRPRNPHPCSRSLMRSASAARAKMPVVVQPNRSGSREIVCKRKCRNAVAVQVPHLHRQPKVPQRAPEPAGRPRHGTSRPSRNRLEMPVPVVQIKRVRLSKFRDLPVDDFQPVRVPPGHHSFPFTNAVAICPPERRIEFSLFAT